MNFLILKIVSKYTYFDRDALTVGVKLYRLENLSKQKKKKTTQPSPPKKEKYTNKQKKPPKITNEKTPKQTKTIVHSFIIEKKNHILSKIHFV